MRHRAARVVLQDAVERLDGRRKPEGVEQRDAAIELLRDSLVAGGRKVHRAETAGRAAVIVLVLGRHGPGEEDKAKARTIDVVATCFMTLSLRCQF